MSERHPESVAMHVELDKDRFEGQSLNGESGYFDKIERVFISRKSFGTPDSRSLSTH